MYNICTNVWACCQYSPLHTDTVSELSESFHDQKKISKKICEDFET